MSAEGIACNERRPAPGERPQGRVQGPPRRGARGGRRGLRHEQRRDRGPGRRVRLRQDHARALDHGAAAAARRRDPRPRRGAPLQPPLAARAPAHRADDLPGPHGCAERPADDLRGRGRGRAHPEAARQRGGARGRGALARGPAAARAVLHPLPVRDLGRPAPARDHRRGDGPEPEPARGRRAGVEPRRLDPRGDPGADAEARARDAGGDPRGDPRPRARLERGQPRGRHVPGPDRRGGPDRGDPERAAPPVHARAAVRGARDRADGPADPHRRGARPDTHPARLPLPPALPAGRVGAGGHAWASRSAAAARIRSSCRPATRCDEHPPDVHERSSRRRERRGVRGRAGGGARRRRGAAAASGR